MSTTQEMAICTCTKAAASCVTWPSVSSPEMYLGAANSNGTMGIIGPEALVIQVRWPCCHTMAIQRATTVS